MNPDFTLLSFSLRDLRHQTSSYALDLAQQISRAAEGQASVHPAITRRANIGELERSINFVQEGLAGLRRDNEKSAQFSIICGSSPLTVTII
jgi:methyl-accepting chemotaxis protein